MTPLMENIVANSVSGLLVAGVTGIVAYFLGNHFLSLYADTNKLRKYGISKLRDGGVFLDKELVHIFTKAKVIKIYYTSGREFFERNLELIDQRLKKNPDCNIRVILGNKESSFVENVTNAERKHDTRKYTQTGIGQEIEEISKLLNERGISYKYDAGMFFLPYLIAEFEEETIAYLNLTIPPVSASKSMMIISRMENNENRRNMAAELNTHFEAAWKVAVEERLAVTERKC